MHQSTIALFPHSDTALSYSFEIQCFFTLGPPAAHDATSALPRLDVDRRSILLTLFCAISTDPSDASRRGAPPTAHYAIVPARIDESAE